MKLLEQHKCFDGYWQRYEHFSSSCQCEMTFSIFLPFDVQQGETKDKKAALFWLSGLTCNDQNFVQKAACERYAVQHQMIIVAPDTSPRGVDIEGEDDDWDFGSGAGFYLDATKKPWQSNYNMYTYIVDELFKLVTEQFPIDVKRIGISGHSMGGHGALTIGLKHPDQFRSVSAFAPICAPSQVAWGKKAFSGYLEQGCELEQYDACQLIAKGYRVPHIKVDQGKADDFLEPQLKPELLLQACHEAEVPLELSIRDGYDHSYFFIASFIDDHIAYHKAQLSGMSE
ncbi:S-formylglutathione hydrolase [Pleionea sediminis]|uniref:S-formylglutathione hydrolase n=1 Tax=Pleionea sediminis TaxID=2569479 RepID=UPI001185F6B1|nr:S-formylglutathione hydrolase [Pleionea sediminis]